MHPGTKIDDTEQRLRASEARIAAQAEIIVRLARAGSMDLAMVGCALLRTMRGTAAFRREKLHRLRAGVVPSGEVPPAVAPRVRRRGQR
jgi:hypothetical protein